MISSSTGETTFWDVVQEVADEWQRAGWLRKDIQGGQEYWQLTPLGRQELAKERARRATREATGV
jgi:hypothetical protein